MSIDCLFRRLCHWCAPTNKFYVGVTRRKVEERLQEHKCGKRQFIDKEIQALGWENSWDWWVVEKDIPSNLISAREQWWISFFNSVHPNGYNRTIGGIDYFEFSKESREKLSKSKRGKPSNRKGKHHTETAKSKIRAYHIGKHNSPETRAKISESNKGKRHSSETRAKISESHKGIKPSDETRAKMSESHKRENLSPETRAKISATTKGENHHMYGKHHSPETRAKISATLKARNAEKRAAEEKSDNQDKTP